MRCLIFILLLFCSAAFSQKSEEVNIDQIQGTWWLNTVQVEHFADNSTDKISSGVNSDYALEITEDSVFFRSPELRYYKKLNTGFTYSITSDSIFKTHILNLFTGKGKHKKKADSYNFKLVNGLLILSSFYEPDANFDMLTQTNYYTYSRFKDEEKLYEKISGAWITRSYGFVDSQDSDTIYYTRKSTIQNDFTGIEVSFKTVHGEPRMYYEYTYSLSSGTNEIYDGVYVASDCFIIIKPDQKELIIGNDERKTVFHIVELTDEKMIIIRH